MPTSNPYQLNELIELILLSKPKSILDIGTGFGKYGVLSREYLEFYDEQKNYLNWKNRIDGIEAFRDYLTPMHDFIYDNIYIGNAIDVLPSLGIKYDLILVIDVLEHFDYDEGLKVLEQCEKRGRNIIISTPLKVGDQKGIFGNPYETHRSQWRRKDFTRFANKCFIYNDRSLICYIGSGAHDLKHSRRSRFRAGLKILFPILGPLYRLIKRYSK
jgi:hypothetical protein